MLVARRFFLSMGLAVPAVLTAGLDSDKAQYVGGTLAVPEKSEGKLVASDEAAAKFIWKGGEIAIPYKQITSLEYGQKAGRRVGVAIMVSPLALFSKKRKHYFTIGYNDSDGKAQGVVFELGKGVVRSTLISFETRSGKQIEYESEDAKKNIGN